MDKHFLAIVRAGDYTLTTRHAWDLWWWRITSPTVGEYYAPESYILKRHAQAAGERAIELAVNKSN